MSINLLILLEHRLEASDLVLFPGRASESTKMRKTAEHLWTLMGKRWSNLGPMGPFTTFMPDERLSAEEIAAAWELKSPPSFEWAGFSVWIGRRDLQATHVEKLAGFVLDMDELREPLRACALALAEELGSTKVVYGPDSASLFERAAEGVFEGQSLRKILENARAQCGPPAPNIRGMAAGDDDPYLLLDGPCYFIESI